MRSQQRAEHRRQAFHDQLTSFDDAHIVWVDECGMHSEWSRLYGRGPRGPRIVGEISGERIVPRTRMIAAYGEGHLLTPFRFDGHTDSVVFNVWVEQCLWSQLKAGQVVMLDNASFHTSYKTRQLIESADCQRLFQPAYSPDLHKIEPQWAHVKQGVRANQETDVSIHQKLDMQRVQMSEP
ncbi:MAG: transposase [Chloroflexota bacterium]